MTASGSRARLAKAMRFRSRLKQDDRCRLSYQDLQIPPERERQFHLIEVASEDTLKKMRASGKSLEFIYPVVPFVESDFSLDAWLFVDTENTLRQYRSDETAGVLAAEFRAELANAGYPVEWLHDVRCHFGSKELVDRDYEGSYYNFLR